MKKVIHAEHITSLDLAKVLGFEEEYREMLLEEEEKKNYEILMEDEKDTELLDKT
jgi:hypothetical protein